jgi:hypothetical protein
MACSNLECQYKRQLGNMKNWRSRNPNYFKYKEVKDATWKDSCRERARKWRHTHLEYLKLYRQEHKEAHREYMRKYMREYRKRKREKMEKQEEISPETGSGNQPNEKKSSEAPESQS